MECSVKSIQSIVHLVWNFGVGIWCGILMVEEAACVCMCVCVVGKDRIYDKSLYSQFYCKPKTALKNKVYYFFKGKRRSVPGRN